MFRLMITAVSSNSGKTAVTCGLLSLLKRRGYDPCAFKCGPDYIDPMFHRTVLGIPSSNLDVFLAGEGGVRETFARNCEGYGIAVCEGVMGYYDGITGSSAAASAWHVARLCGMPAVLVLRPKGAALTLAAVIKGMAEFQPDMNTEETKGMPSEDSRSISPAGGMIRGVILNDCSEMYYRTYGPVIEKASGIPVLGYLPHMEEAVFESRHLGLMTAEEIRDLGSRIDRIGARMEKTIDLEKLLSVLDPSEAEDEKTGQDGQTAGGGHPDESKTFYQGGSSAPPVRIAVAKDAAFNFIYAESIAALERAGAQIVYFSPLADECLPPDVHGLYLPGGYPELYGKQLSENESMRTSIRNALKQTASGASVGPLPTIAECGGFLYLGESLADAEGETWTMVGALPGHGAGTGKLVRFGYGHIGCEQNSMLFRRAEQVPVHEFHYWDTTAQGSDLILTKNSNGKQWAFGYATQTLYAGFPHLYLAGRAGSDEQTDTLAYRFVGAARKHDEAAGENSRRADPECASSKAKE